jgi:hypothetical protein
VLAPLHALIRVQQTIPHATAMAPPHAHPTPKAARARSHRLTGPRARENARVSFAEDALWNRIVCLSSVFRRIAQRLRQRPNKGLVYPAPLAPLMFPMNTSEDFPQMSWFGSVKSAGAHNQISGVLAQVSSVLN